MKIMRIVFACILVSLSFNSAATDYQEAVLSSVLDKHLHQFAKRQEGLDEGTKVQVDDDIYHTIDDLAIGDIIYSPEKESYQEVILKEQFYVPYFFEIKTKECTIHAAPAQRFYDEQTQEWVEAQNMIIDQSVGGSFVESVTKIEKYCSVRKLNVSDHVFAIEHDKLLAHNSALAIATGFTVELDKLILFFPVIVELGRTISSGKMWNQFYKIWELEEDKKSDCIYEYYITQLVEKTRSYYQSRRQALLDLLQKYQNMQQIVSAISERSSIQLGALNPYVKNQLHSFPLLPSVDCEVNYSDAERQQLLELRDQDLFGIEQEIGQIQLSLGIYFNEMIHHKDCLISHLSSVISELQQVKSNYSSVVQAAYRNRNALSVVKQILVKQYELIVSIDMYVQHLIACSEEWAILFNIYLNESSTLLFRQSSNIVESFGGKYFQEMLEIPQDLKQQLGMIQSQYRACNQLLIRHGISLSQRDVQSFVNAAQLIMKKADDQNRKNIEIKKSNLNHKAPKDDPDPEDDEGSNFFRRLRKRFKGKARHKDKLLFEDPDTKLWWSLDKARHAGYHCKVYIAGKKAFEWIYNADLFGNEIVGQHKGPMFRIIPYKEVVFLR